MDRAELSRYVRDIPDFPEPGILFRDLTPLFLAPKAFAAAVETVAEPFVGAGIDRVLGIESRGFILGAPVAQRLGAGFGLIRKAGKLPFRTHRVEYALEYGTDTMEMHVDTVEPEQRVLIIDDVIATGGTAMAAECLVREAGGDVVGCSFLIELDGLAGRKKLRSQKIHSVIHY